MVDPASSAAPADLDNVLIPLAAAVCVTGTDEEIDKISWENTAKFFNWDPFKHTPREQATVGALRALSKDVDVSETSKAEYRRRYETAGV